MVGDVSVDGSTHGSKQSTTRVPCPNQPNLATCEAEIPSQACWLRHRTPNTCSWGMSVSRTASPAHIRKAVSLLRSLQEIIEGVVDGSDVSTSRGNALSDGMYLQLCQLTGGMHAALHAAQVDFCSTTGARQASNALTDHDQDEPDGNWTIRRARRMPGGAIIVTYA